MDNEESKQNQPNNNLVEIMPSKEGVMSKNASCVVFLMIALVVFSTFIGLLNSCENKIYKKYDVSSYNELERYRLGLSYGSKKYIDFSSSGDDEKIVLITVGLAICYSILVLAVLICFFTMFVTRIYSKIFGIFWISDDFKFA